MSADGMSAGGAWNRFETSFALTTQTEDKEGKVGLAGLETCSENIVIHGVNSVDGVQVVPIPPIAAALGRLLSESRHGSMDELNRLAASILWRSERV